MIKNFVCHKAINTATTVVAAVTAEIITVNRFDNASSITTPLVYSTPSFVNTKE